MQYQTHSHWAIYRIEATVLFCFCGIHMKNVAMDDNRYCRHSSTAGISVDIWMLGTFFEYISWQVLASNGQENSRQTLVYRRPLEPFDLSRTNRREFGSCCRPPVLFSIHFFVTANLPRKNTCPRNLRILNTTKMYCDQAYHCIVGTSRLAFKNIYSYLEKLGSVVVA